MTNQRQLAKLDKSQNKHKNMPKIAIIKTGGKQYLVKEKDKLKIEKLALDEGAKVDFDTLLIADGDEVEIGAPLTAGKVSATVLRQLKDKKVIGVKYKRKTRQHKKFGHRQRLTEVEITGI